MPEIIRLNTLDDPRASVYKNLTERQMRSLRDPTNAVFIAESPHVIEKALEAGCRPVSVLCAERHITGKAADIIDRCNAPVLTASDNELEQLTGYALTRGILCAMHRPKERNMTDLSPSVHRLAVLHNLTDASNVGAIFRSAAALGYDGIMLTGSCCDPLGRKAVRVSMGTVFQIFWCRGGDDWPEFLRERGFITAAMALHGDSIDMDDSRLPDTDKLAIVLGNEGSGLPVSISERCDYTVRIPMAAHVDSLNVAAAAAVAFWQTRRKDT